MHANADVRAQGRHSRYKRRRSGGSKGRYEVLLSLVQANVAVGTSKCAMSVSLAAFDHGDLLDRVFVPAARM
jgi:hypothetical protein